ncbi:MAG: hypothetical protein WC938_01735 [Candidatus Paceibacterota bacterium]|jgi:hypothetical protein
MTLELSEVKTSIEKFINGPLTDDALIAFLNIVRESEDKAEIKLVMATTDINILCDLSISRNTKIRNLARQKLKSVAPERLHEIEQKENLATRMHTRLPKKRI